MMKYINTYLKTKTYHLGYVFWLFRSCDHNERKKVDCYDRKRSKKNVKNISETFRVLLVTGPRQVGKTTLLKEYMPKNMNYITLDDITLREFAKKDSKLFLEEHPWPLLIDEAQYAPELFPYIKIKVDEEKKEECIG